MPITFWAQKTNTVPGEKDIVFSFFEYNIKDETGIKDAFNTGYEIDLEWHKSQGDNWAWIGWYVTNGERRGRFIDATPNHLWSDFDNWNVNEVLNGKMNKIHWASYVEEPSGSYRIVLSEYSSSKEDWYTSKSLQVHKLEISVSKEKVFNEFLKSYKTYLESYLKDIQFIWMKTVSGGGNQEYQLFICIDKMDQMEMANKIFSADQMPESLWEQYSEAVISNDSEMWKYMPKLSLYPENK